MTDVGTNLSPIVYWSTEYPFIDRMKSSSGLVYVGSSDTVKVNANGYPVDVPTGSQVMTLVDVDPVSAGTDRNYVLTYTGTASFQLVGATIISSEPGKITFHMDEGYTITPLIMSGLNASDPLTDLHFVREDQFAAFQQGAIFNDTFLAKTSIYDTLRFMDWTNTNSSTVSSWSDRSTVNDRSWGTSDNASVPIEVQVALANTLHKDMWINIPTDADDTYVRNTLQYVKDHLSSDLKVNIEYSNEVWNWGFKQAAYAQAQANKLWAIDSNGNGTIDPNEAVANGNEEYYGYRAAQIGSLTQQVFGNSTQAQMVLATQTAYVGLEQYIFDGVARANVGSVGSLFSDYAVTTYFGDSLGGATDADKATILSWAKSGAAGLDAAFKELEFGGTLQSNWGSLAALFTALQYQANIATQYGLKLTAYEGGLGVWAVAFDTADQPAIMDFFARLAQDPRIGDLYAKVVTDFSKLGGSLLNVFTDVQADATFGNFGTLKSIYGDSTIYDALSAMHDAASGSSGTSTNLTSYTLSPTESGVNYLGSSTFTGVGNDLNNTIIGGNAGNSLYGGGGNDTLRGGKGNDYLDGGTGADTMAGGDGDDTYIVDDPNDVVIEAANGGTDEVRTALSAYTLSINVEKLTYTGSGTFSGTGNLQDNTIVGSALGANTLNGGAGNDTLYGGAGNDILDGGTGDDTMVGGLGDDIYYVDSVNDVVVEGLAGGTDEVRTTLANYALGANVENLTYAGSAAFTGTGNALDNVIKGGDGGNTLSGGLGNDTLYGGAGADILDGGTGADYMAGGAGNDIYYVDNVGDQVVEAANGGIDEVRTTLANYTLGANLENLTSIGTGSGILTGNDLDNVIRGNDSINRLYGGAGNDSLYGGANRDLLDGGTGADYMAGGAGDDVYWVDNVGDVVFELPNQGIDRVKTTLNGYALTDNVEQLVFLGTGSFTGIGNALDNLIAGGDNGNSLSGGAGNDTLLGGVGNDTLDGGAGADIMTGGAGDDTYFVDNVGDQVIEQAGGGTDTVYSSINYTLGNYVENLSLIGSDAINGTGNALDNFMVGNSAANMLSGGGGNDYIIAGAGDDILDGGDGNDVLVGQDGNDTLYGGTGNDSLYGGDGNDILIGGDGQDWLQGDAGADRFVFKVGDLGTSITSTDTIADFSRGEGDKIDLSGYDANANTVQLDPFTFIDSSAFTNHAGELRVDNIGGRWNVMGDTNGDGIADFVLNVTSLSGALIASDFIGLASGGTSLSASGLSLTADETAAANAPATTRMGISYTPFLSRKLDFLMQTDMLLAA